MAKNRSPLKNEYARPLREAKIKLRITTQELAQMSGVACGTVVRIMQGDTGVLLRHLLSVVKSLGLEPNITFSSNKGKVIELDSKSFTTVTIKIESQ